MTTETINPRKKPRGPSRNARALAAATAGLTLIAVAGATGAGFIDRVDPKTDTLTFGTLRIASSAHPAWELNGVPVDLEDVHIVPGDVLTFSPEYSIETVGNDLYSMFDYQVSASGHNATIDTLELPGVVTIDVDGDGVPEADLTGDSTGASGGRAVMMLEPYDGRREITPIITVNVPLFTHLTDGLRASPGDLRDLTSILQHQVEVYQVSSEAVVPELSPVPGMGVLAMAENAREIAEGTPGMISRWDDGYVVSYTTDDGGDKGVWYADKTALLAEWALDR